jgi:L-asparaginase
MNPHLWQKLVELIEQNYELYDAFVVLHGSDTMAYTSSALSFMLENLSKPVILTGSQLPIGILRSDARENLISAIELAMATRDDGAPLINEVAVYFEYKLYRGNRIYKNSSEHFEAFDSPNYPVLAELGVEMKVNHHALLSQPVKPVTFHKKLNSQIAVIPLFPGFNEKIISKIRAAGVEAVILRTYGAGNAPDYPAFLEEVESCIKNGIVVANVSQCRKGAVNQLQYTAGRNLEQLGVIGAGDMTLEAAITKMMFLLGQDLACEECSKKFVSSISGEITE